MASKTAGSATVNVTGEAIYDDARGCTVFFLRVDPASAAPALVNVPGLHDAADFLPVPVGATMLFRLFHQGIVYVWAKGNGANASISFGVVSKTNR